MTVTTQTANPVRVPLYKGVSCVTFLRSHDGTMSNANWFDVPNESYTDGNLTGVKAAYEVMASARNGDFDGFQSVHEAAHKVLSASEKSPYGTRDGAGAAVGYLGTMAEILELAAQKLDLSELMASSLGAHEDMLQTSLSDVKADNAAFVARMTGAKTQKKRGSATPQRGSA